MNEPVILGVPSAIAGAGVGSLVGHGTEEVVKRAAEKINNGITAAAHKSVDLTTDGIKLAGKGISKGVSLGAKGVAKGVNYGKDKFGDFLKKMNNKGNANTTANTATNATQPANPNPIQPNATMNVANGSLGNANHTPNTNTANAKANTNANAKVTP